MESKKNNKGKIIVSCVILALILVIGGIAVVSELVYQKHRAAQLETAVGNRPVKEIIQEQLQTPIVIGDQSNSISFDNKEQTEATDEGGQETPAIDEGEQQETQNNELAPLEEPKKEPETVATANGRKVAIDAGHQGKGNSEHEPIGPGATETKPKVASGTHGNASGLDEYELNLTVSLKLRDELVKRGYEVYMIRETHDVNISNRERAELATSSGSDILVRIHANGSDNTSISGALCMAPAGDNPFLSRELITKSNNLSQEVISAFCESTGAKNMGVQTYNNMSGINWTKIPVTIVEMGFMTNQEDDLHMADSTYQDKMVQGIANGIDAYYQIPQ